MTVFLHDDDLAGVVDLGELVDTVRTLHVDLALGHAEQPVPAIIDTAPSTVLLPMVATSHRLGLTAVKILTDASYWNDQKSWRFYGDKPRNWATVGGQQSKPDHALVEKLTNALRVVQVTKLRIQHPFDHRLAAHQLQALVDAAHAAAAAAGEHDAGDVHAGALRKCEGGEPSSRRNMALNADGLS